MKSSTSCSLAAPRTAPDWRADAAEADFTIDITGRQCAIALVVGAALERFRHVLAAIGWFFVIHLVLVEFDLKLCIGF